MKTWEPPEEPIEAGAGIATVDVGMRPDILGLFGEYMCSFPCRFRFCGVSVSLNELHKWVQISFGLVQGWDYPQRKYDWIKSFVPFLSIS